MLAIDRPHAISRLAHRIAGCVHVMLADRDMTVGELKDKLAQFPAPVVAPETVDAILRAEEHEKVTGSDLSDIAFALGFEWGFRVEKIPDEPVGQGMIEDAS